jgi:hypothetical protein
VRHDRHRRGREPDCEDHQAGYRGPVVPEIPDGRVVGRIEEHRCDEKRQREFGRNREGRRTRKKCEQRTAERQEHRIRRSDAACQGREDDSGDEEYEKLFQSPGRLPVPRRR